MATQFRRVDKLKFTTQHCSGVIALFLHRYTDSRAYTVQSSLIRKRPYRYVFDLAASSSSNYCTARPTEINEKVSDLHCQSIDWKFD